MSPQNVWKASLLTAGISSAAMALYHLWMPAQFGWPEKLRAAPPAIAWGAVMINACFSILLLINAGLTVFCALRWSKRDALTWSCVAGIGGFWAFNAAYQVVSPMPLPERLRLLGWILMAFAVVTTCLYGVALTAALYQPREPVPGSE
jgi:hypothetical protein